MGLTQASVIALGVFVAGLIYHAGQLSQRLSTVERDTDRVYGELRSIKSGLDQLIGAKRVTEQ